MSLNYSSLFHFIVRYYLLIHCIAFVCVHVSTVWSSTTLSPDGIIETSTQEGSSNRWSIREERYASMLQGNREGEQPTAWFHFQKHIKQMAQGRCCQHRICTSNQKRRSSCSSIGDWRKFDQACAGLWRAWRREGRSHGGTQSGWSVHKGNSVWGRIQTTLPWTLEGRQRNHHARHTITHKHTDMHAHAQLTSVIPPNQIKHPHMLCIMSGKTWMKNWYARIKQMPAYKKIIKCRGRGVDIDKLRYRPSHSDSLHYAQHCSYHTG